MSDPRPDLAERIASSLADAGIARLPARVFAALLVDDDGRMTSSELVEFLHVSAAAISGAVKYLGQMGLIRRERERGSRRDLYVVDDDAWHGLMLRRDQMYAPIKAALAASINALGPQAPAHERLVLTREFLTFIEDHYREIATAWEQHKRTLGLGP